MVAEIGGRCFSISDAEVRHEDTTKRDNFHSWCCKLDERHNHKDEYNNWNCAKADHHRTVDT